MLDSFEEFKTAIHKSLMDKVSERMTQEREHISNCLFRGIVNNPTEYDEEQTQSNETEN